MHAFFLPGLGIYKRKKESKKTRKHALDQESVHKKELVQEKKKFLNKEKYQFYFQQLCNNLSIRLI